MRRKQNFVNNVRDAHFHQQTAIKKKKGNSTWNQNASRQQWQNYIAGVTGLTPSSRKIMENKILKKDKKK